MQVRFICIFFFSLPICSPLPMGAFPSVMPSIASQSYPSYWYRTYNISSLRLSTVALFFWFVKSNENNYGRARNEITSDQLPPLETHSSHRSRSCRQQRSNLIPFACDPLRRDRRPIAPVSRPSIRSPALDMNMHAACTSAPRLKSPSKGNLPLTRQALRRNPP